MAVQTVFSKILWSVWQSETNIL